MDRRSFQYQQVQSQSSALIQAIERGDMLRVNKCLSAGANVDYVRHDGTTPLTAAVARGYTAIVRQLIHTGCRINLQPDIIIRSKTIKADSAIHIAAIKENRLILQLLIEASAQVDLPGSSGNTALSKAAFHGKYDSVRMLIQAGACVNAFERHQMSPLHWAALGGHVDIAMILVDNMAEVNARNVNQETALILAAGKGHLGVVKVLLDKGHQCDIDAVTLTGKTTEVMTGHTALHVASREGFVYIVRSLLVSLARVDIRDGTKRNALMWAAKEGHAEIVDLLLQSDSSVNYRNCLGQTALYEATHGSHIHAVELLLQSGADPNIVTNTGKTPLLRAVSLDNPGLVRLLLQANCDVDQAGPRRVKPFHLAAGYGHLNTLQMVVTAGCSVSDITRWVAHGCVPVKLAVHPHVVLFLLALANNPLSLKLACARYIRRKVGINLAKKVETLDIPTAMKGLLCLKELDQYVGISQEHQLGILKE